MKRSDSVESANDFPIIQEVPKINRQSRPKKHKSHKVPKESSIERKTEPTGGTVVGHPTQGLF